MCLITDQVEPIIAANDITVYKVLQTKGLWAMVHTFKYKLRTLFQTEIKTSREYVTGDSHAHYEIVKKYPDYCGINGPVGLISYGEGFHSYESFHRTLKCIDNISSCYFTKFYGIYECIIPAGSEYYTSVGGTEFVSNQIIIKKKISP